MNDVSNPFLRAISALNSSGHPYIVVGGFAIVMYGVSRFTPDINVVIPFDEDTTGLLDVLKSHNFIPAGNTVLEEQFLSPDGRERLAKEGRWFYSLVDEQAPSFRIDLFLQYPLPYEELVRDATNIEIGDESLKICSPDHLLEMKRNAGRGQDIADIENLTIARTIEECKGNRDEIVAKLPPEALDRLDDLIEFRALSSRQKVDWLLEMLTELAKFCIV